MYNAESFLFETENKIKIAIIIVSSTIIGD